MTAAHYDDNGASEQLAEDPVDRQFRGKFWTALYFGLAVFWIAAAAVVVGVLR